jgi:hypothetical protein
VRYLDVDKLPERVRRDLLDRADYSREEVQEMSPGSAFEAWLEWHGIIGYTELILEAVNGIYRAERDTRELALTRFVICQEHGTVLDDPDLVSEIRANWVHHEGQGETYDSAPRSEQVAAQLAWVEPMPRPCDMLKGLR